MRRFVTSHGNTKFVSQSIEAEIQVGVGEKMAENRIQFPSKRSLEGDYVQFFESTFKTAGTVHMYSRSL